MSPLESVDGFPQESLTFRFVRSRGPGGQHVNKASTAVQLRADLERSDLPAPVLERLRAVAGHHLTTHDEIVITADRHRSQLRNREDALARLAEFVRLARHRPARRIATKPSAAARRRRVQEKKLHGARKKLRRTPREDQG